MLKRSFKRSILFLPITLAVLLFSTYIWVPGPFIVPPSMAGFSDNTEMAVPTILIAFCCFILYDKYEIELGLVCGTSTVKLFFCKALPILVYTLLPTYLMLFLYKYVPYSGNSRPKIPIYVPENFKVYAALSLFVTVFFFFALFIFLRVLMRNCYAPIFACLFFDSISQGLCGNIKKGVTDVKLSIINPYISATMIGNEVPNAYAEQVEGMEIMKNAWTHNRLLFFALGVVLLVLTYLLLRREKLHQGFGD